MSSHHQSSYIQPFGYAFDEPDQCTSNSEPLPDAAGPPLLDDTDSHLLNDFFSNPDSFDASSTLLCAGGNEKGEPAPADSWTYSLPPSFKGASTVVTAPVQGNLPAAEFTSSNRSDQHGNTSQDPIHSSTSEDVLGAASTLFNSFQTGGPHLLSDTALSALGGVSSLESLHDPHNVGRAFTMVTAPQGHNAYHPEAPSLRSSSAALSTGYPSHFQFLTPGLSQSHQTSSVQYADFRRFYKFGSDGNFSSNGYNLPPRQETEEEITKRLLQDVKAMRELTPSSTQPSSPRLKFITRKPPAHERSFGTKLPEEHPSTDIDSSKNDRQKKRRKHGINGSEEDSEAKPSAPLNSRNKKSSPSTTIKDRKASHGGSSSANKVADSATSASNTRNAASTPSPSVKRRKSQVSAGQKAARENLTEEQKRNNHILSEQKRRNLIKQGFEDLHMLVPELRSGNFSKSNVLVEAAIFLENLVKGNEELAAKLGSSWNKR